MEIKKVCIIVKAKDSAGDGYYRLDYCSDEHGCWSTFANYEMEENEFCSDLIFNHLLGLVNKGYSYMGFIDATE